MSQHSNARQAVMKSAAPQMNQRAFISVSLLTGGQDRHYAYGLATALAAQDVSVEIIGSDSVECPEFHNTPGLTFLNLRGNQRREAGIGVKVLRILRYYARLIGYAATAQPKVFHILWNNKFEYFDRTLLMLYYKCLGRKITLTAHNVNAGRRDGSDTLLNRVTLRIQYLLVDHIFAHTRKMKSELMKDFGVREGKITLVPYGINNAVPDTALTRTEAKQRLGLSEDDKAVLFFGAIAPYKGLDLLVDAFRSLVAADSRYQLVVAGLPKGGCQTYLEDVQKAVAGLTPTGRVLQSIRHIPDDEVEIYFKAADVVALPYREIFQSGILFMAYSFGVPVVATDVGEFRGDIIEGKTGFLCRPGQADALAAALQRYFHSELFQQLNSKIPEITELVTSRHSWSTVAAMTRDVHSRLLDRSSKQSANHRSVAV
jgi:glycosyltransferase involved in cell wall biosynthesis